MKRKMKKLLAVLMAVAMVLSLSVTAFAGEDEDASYEGQPYGGDTGETTLYNPPGLSYSDSVEGSSKSEGPLPGDPIEIILPTVAEAEEGTMGVFDMILDPHNMITKTNAARYAEDGVTKTFDDQGAKLYFATSVTDDGQEYSGTSQTLKIINKSHMPVNVDLSLDFKYDGLEDVITLISNEEEFANAADGLNDEGPQMYLALVRGVGEVEAAEGEEDEEAGETESNVDIQAVKPLALEDDETTDVDETAPVIVVKGDGDYLAAGGVTFEWGTDDEDIRASVKDLTFTLSYSPRDVTEDNEGTTDVDEGGQPIPAKITVTGAWGDEEYVFDTVSASDDGIFVDEESFGASDEAIEVAIEVKESSANNAATLATVTLNILKPNFKTMKESETQVVSFKAPVAGAIINTAIGMHPTAYHYAFWTGEGNVQGDFDVPQGLTAAGYYWEQDTDIPDSEYPFITFNLIGNINNDLQWDSLDIADTGISFELIWDVIQRSTYNKSIELAMGKETQAPEESGGGSARLTGDKPTVTVTTAASGTQTNTKKLVLTWTKGTDSYEAYTPSTTLVLSNGSTLTMTASGQTLTNTNAYATIGATSTTGTVTFTADGLPDYEVTVEGLRSK